MIHRLCRLWLGSVLALLVSPAIAAPPRFDFQDNDRVVFLGGAFLEREAEFGYLETALTSAKWQRNITFRNFGSKGDTVWAESRGLLELPAAGHQQTLDLIKEFQPTVLFLAYGAQESLAGESGLEPFIAQYEKLLDELKAVIGPSKEFRCVFLTPHQWEPSKPPQPDASAHNPILGRYAQAIRDLAQRRKGWVVDFYERTAPVTLNQKGSASPTVVGPEPPRGFALADGVWKSLPLTENGTDLSPYGDLRLSRILLQELKLPRAEFLLQLDSEGEPEADTQTLVSDFHSDGMRVQFKVVLSRLPEPPTPIFLQDAEFFMIAGGGLTSGSYALKIDGKVAAVNPTMLVGFPIRTGADYDQAERLRKKIVAKNQLLRYCVHPDLNTSLIGAREQNCSVADIARLDRLIDKLEAEIVQLKKPMVHQYEILPRVIESEKK